MYDYFWKFLTSLSPNLFHKSQIFRSAGYVIHQQIKKVSPSTEKEYTQVKRKFELAYILHFLLLSFIDCVHHRFELEDKESDKCNTNT